MRRCNKFIGHKIFLEDSKSRQSRFYLYNLQDLDFYMTWFYKIWIRAFTNPINAKFINVYLTSTTKVVLEAQWGYVQRSVCFVNIQSSLHENVVFSVCARMGNAAYIIFIMWNSISGLDAWYHFRFNISCGVAVMVRGHQNNFR